jgi:hypothetical protein
MKFFFITFVCKTEGRRHLGIKNKKIYFVLLSACTTFSSNK